MVKSTKMKDMKTNVIIDSELFKGYYNYDFSYSDKIKDFVNQTKEQYLTGSENNVETIRDDIKKGSDSVSVKNRTGKKISKTAKSQYKPMLELLTQDNYKEFMSTILQKSFVDKYSNVSLGFANNSEVYEEMCDYFKLCINLEIPPTIPSLCGFLGISLNVFYNTANDTTALNYDLVNKAIINIQAIQETSAISGQINSNLYTFLSRNYYGLKDTQQIALNDSREDNNNVAVLQAIKQQLDDEKQDN